MGWDGWGGDLACAIEIFFGVSQLVFTFTLYQVLYVHSALLSQIPTLLKLPRSSKRPGEMEKHPNTENTLHPLPTVAERASHVCICMFYVPDCDLIIISSSGC
jgi:hypothetical protein